MKELDIFTAAKNIIKSPFMITLIGILLVILLADRGYSFGRWLYSILH